MKLLSILKVTTRHCGVHRRYLRIVTTVQCPLVVPLYVLFAFVVRYFIGFAKAVKLKTVASGLEAPESQNFEAAPSAQATTRGSSHAADHVGRNSDIYRPVYRLRIPPRWPRINGPHRYWHRIFRVWRKRLMMSAQEHGQMLWP